MAKYIPDFSQIFGTKRDEDPKQPSPVSLGVNIGRSDKNINQEIEQVTKQIQRTNKKYTDEISKYKEVAKFNQKLTQSYVQNLQVIVDISKLLEQYANVFYVLREETEKLEQTLGMDFSIAKFQYLENMTKDKMQELNTQFMKETSNLKTLYEQFGKTDEARSITNAQTLMASVATDSKATYDKLTELDKLNKTTVGGASKTAKKQSTKPPKRNQKSRSFK